VMNTPLAQKELQQLRSSLRRGTPFGASAWTKVTAARLGLESSLRPPGRPCKSEAAAEVLPQRCSPHRDEAHRSSDPSPGSRAMSDELPLSFHDRIYLGTARFSAGYGQFGYAVAILLPPKCSTGASGGTISA